MLIKKKLTISKSIVPSHKDIYPYIQDIKNEDVNSGKRPLQEHLKKRFQKLFDTNSGTVSILSNGTYALTNALRASNATIGSYCLMPSWCCPSIPFAAIYAGLKPFFIDVDSESWTLEKQTTLESLMFVEGDVGAVIVPSSFGQSIDTYKWDEFTQETGIPVVIDASNSYDSILSKSESSPSLTPIVIGFNKYSSLCFGDAGIVVCKNNELIDKINSLCYLGGKEYSEQLFIGTNGIISEYSAAACHAALDNWEATRAKWYNLNNQYIETLVETTLHHRLSLEFISDTCNIYLLGNNADSTIEHLKSKGIESRRWLGKGCHNMKEFKDLPRTNLPITKNLVSSVIGLPFYIGMQKKDIEQILRAISTNVYGKNVTPN